MKKDQFQTLVFSRALWVLLEMRRIYWLDHPWRGQHWTSKRVGANQRGNSNIGDFGEWWPSSHIFSIRSDRSHIQNRSVFLVLTPGTIPRFENLRAAFQKYLCPIFRMKGQNVPISATEPAGRGVLCHGWSISFTRFARWKSAVFQDCREFNSLQNSLAKRQ